jgi:non-ribosomal peptide synthetase component E (peptide arylation enzyme)
MVQDANAAFERCGCFRLYGSTEAPTVTLGVPDPQQRELAATTEGYVVGHEIRLVDACGETVAPGQEGEIVTRGPEMCVGYAAPEQNAEAFDAEGYFHTGDLARITPEGCLIITGRKKDLIIRGGENISPKEIEDVLYAHPAVREAAVVAMPHPRLGETACAFVTLREGGAFDFAEMRRTLERSGLTNILSGWRSSTRCLTPRPAKFGRIFCENRSPSELRTRLPAESCSRQQVSAKQQRASANETVAVVAREHRTR